MLELKAINSLQILPPIVVRKWLQHMRDTLNELVEDKDVDPPTADKVMNFFRYTSYYLVACSEVTEVTKKAGTFDFPLSEKYTDLSGVGGLAKEGGGAKAKGDGVKLLYRRGDDVDGDDTAAEVMIEGLGHIADATAATTWDSGGAVTDGNIF